MKVRVKSENINRTDKLLDILINKKESWYLFSLYFIYFCSDLYDFFPLFNLELCLFFFFCYFMCKFGMFDMFHVSWVRLVCYIVPLWTAFTCFCFCPCFLYCCVIISICPQVFNFFFFDSFSNGCLVAYCVTSSCLLFL